MRRWLSRVRAGVVMGLTWAVPAWFVGIGIELIHNVWPNPLGSMVDIWPAALAYPAFLGGVAFSVVLRIAGRRRRFEELSLPLFAAWGAVGGLIVSLVPAAMVTLGLATPNVPMWQITAGIAGPLMLGSAGAASGTLWLARRAEGPALPGAEDGRAAVRGPR